MRSLIACCVVWSLVFTNQLAHADALTNQAKTLSEQGKWQAVYDMLSAQESERAGDVDFDLLLGLAALETGKNTNAVFALERVLTVEPNNVRARAEIARAYFALGEIRTARKEFEFVNEQPLPDETKINIGKFLAAIEQIESGEKLVIKGFAELTVGYDTNVNAGPTGNQVAVPLFGGLVFTLDPTGVSQKDGFSNFAAGLSLRAPITKGLDLMASLTGNSRFNATYDQYDTGGAEGNVGIAYKQGRDIFSFAYQLDSFYVDKNRFRDSSGLIGQWQRNFDARNQASLFLQHGWLRYPGNTLRDADRTVLGINAAHALPDRKTIFYGGLYTGNEDETNPGVSHVGNNLWGGRVGGQHQLRDDLAIFANLGYENRSYGGRDPMFLTTRSDDQTNIGAGIAWNATPKWRVTTQYAHTRNSSNIPINTYTRDMLSLSARYSF